MWTKEQYNEYVKEKTSKRLDRKLLKVDPSTFTTLGKEDPYQGKEDNLQESIIKLLILKGYKPVHIPNGGNRNIIEAAKLKRMGTTPGMPDIMIFEIKTAIELKVKKGRLSEYQKDCLNWLQSLGWACYVCYNIESIEHIINGYE